MPDPGSARPALSDAALRETLDLLGTVVANMAGKLDRHDQILADGVVCGKGRNPTLRLWPAIFSGEIDVFPSERRNMGQEIGR